MMFAYLLAGFITIYALPLRVVINGKNCDYNPFFSSRGASFLTIFFIAILGLALLRHGMNWEVVLTALGAFLYLVYMEIGLLSKACYVSWDTFWRPLCISDLRIHFVWIAPFSTLGAILAIAISLPESPASASLAIAMFAMLLLAPVLLYKRMKHTKNGRGLW